MYQLTQFADSENIIIIDNMPYYCYTGTTYKDKLKNGLSLDYVFQQEDIIPIINDDPSKEVELYKIKENLELAHDYEDNYEFYDQNKFQTMGLIRKGKRLLSKKRQTRNRKKSNIKSNGYTEKLLVIEENLPQLFDKSQFNFYDKDNISIMSYDNYDENYDEKYDDSWTYSYDENWTYN